MYSASVVDWATVPCRLEYQDTTAPFKKKQYPVVDFEESGQSANEAST